MSSDWVGLRHVGGVVLIRQVFWQLDLSRLCASLSESLKVASLYFFFQHSIQSIIYHGMSAFPPVADLLRETFADPTITVCACGRECVCVSVCVLTLLMCALTLALCCSQWSLSVTLKWWKSHLDPPPLQTSRIKTIECPPPPSKAMWNSLWNDVITAASRCVYEG